MVGQTISHYRVVSQLGAGGMGVVYAAEDPRLGRQVALKFVSEEMIKDSSTIERLKVEARTTSALNHPNICTIYDIGDHNGRPFIVMEILKGRTLRDRLAEGPLKVAETIDLGIQVAEALVAAHARDIIHRDIKPANVFLVDHGPVKVLDFGLAKLTSVPGGDETVAPTADLTAMGTTVGTVSYMSPEQVSGDPLDRRTDLFSLGVVLYECVTGRQPFQGKNSAVILSSILTQQPAPPATLNVTVPPGLQDVIHKCLEKDRELRYQDAAGLRADLKRVKRDLDSGALRTVSTRTLTAAAASAAAAQQEVGSAAVERAHSGSSVALPVPAARNYTTVAVAGVAAIAIVSVGAMMMLSRRSASPPDAPRTAEVVQPSPAPEGVKVAPTPAAPAQPPPAPEARPEPAEVSRAPRTPTPSPRFTAAIVEANRLLAAGDGDGATRALNVARGIDPASPAVADVSVRLVEFYRVEAARRTASEPVRGQSAAPASPPSSVSSPTPPSNSAPVRAPEAAPNATPPAARPQVPESSPASATLPSAQRPAPPAPASTPAAEDDDALIRRVIATYARAIETKDLPLYRSVKPNLTAAEQRTIEEGFRAVTSQRVTVNIQSIEHRGQDAVVRLRRQDVIQAGGRQQTSESQQTVTVTRAPSGWVIREIGR